MAKGLMIVCDGSNGAGKTTILKAISAHLESKGREVVLTREPGGTPIGEKIRALVLSPETPEMCDMTELMLFSAARAQHLNEKILPALAEGKIVLSDRFSAATVSFQHYARGLSLDAIEQLNSLVLGDFKPTINIILDLDPLVGLKRVHARGEGLDRLEDQDINFLNRAREGYLKQAEQYPESFAVINADQPLPSVIQDTLSVIDALL